MEVANQIVSAIHKNVPHDVFKYCTCGKVGQVDRAKLDQHLAQVTALLTENGVDIPGFMEMLNRSHLGGADFIESECKLVFKDFGCVSIERICSMLPIWMLSQDQHLQFSVDPQPV